MLHFSVGCCVINIMLNVLLGVRYLQLKESIARRDKFISKHLKAHLETYKQEVRRDCTDYMMQTRHQNKDVSFVSDSDLEMILANMIFVGTESTLTALLWIIVYLLHWSEYQDSSVKWTVLAHFGSQPRG